MSVKLDLNLTTQISLTDVAIIQNGGTAGASFVKATTKAAIDAVKNLPYRVHLANAPCPANPTFAAEVVVPSSSFKLECKATLELSLDEIASIQANSKEVSFKTVVTKAAVNAVKNLPYRVHFDTQPCGPRAINHAPCARYTIAQPCGKDITIEAPRSCTVRQLKVLIEDRGYDHILCMFQSLYWNGTLIGSGKQSERLRPEDSRTLSSVMACLSMERVSRSYRTRLAIDWSCDHIGALGWMNTLP